MYCHRKPTSILFFGTEELFNLLASFAIGELNIILGGSIIAHQREETVVGNVELQVEFSA